MFLIFEYNRGISAKTIKKKTKGDCSNECLRTSCGPYIYYFHLEFDGTVVCQRVSVLNGLASNRKTSQTSFEISKVVTFKFVLKPRNSFDQTLTIENVDDSIGFLKVGKC